jgi:hypothetical protein
MLSDLRDAIWAQTEDQPDMLETQGLNLEALTPEVRLHIAIHPELVRGAEGVAGTDRWVVAYLLGEILESGRQVFEGLS